MTSWHKTGAHPFYIGMYIHIYTHIYVHKYTSQKECLHIFLVIYLGFRTPRAVGGFLMVLAGYVAINLHKKHCQWVGEYSNLHTCVIYDAIHINICSYSLVLLQI